MRTPPPPLQVGREARLTPAQEHLSEAARGAPGRYGVSWYGRWYSKLIHDTEHPCPWGSREHNPLGFATLEAALRAGHNPCKACGQTGGESGPIPTKGASP